MRESAPSKFPRSSEIKRVIAAVTQAGISVGTVEISIKGTVRVSAGDALAPDPANDFDEWDKRGAL